MSVTPPRTEARPAPGATRRRRRPQSLATRIALLSVGIAVLTAIVAAALATGLIRNTGADSAHRTLQRLADVAHALGSEQPSRPAALQDLRKALNKLGVRSGLLVVDGTATRDLSKTALVRRSATATDFAAVRAGRTVSATRSVNGTTVFVEIRPLADAPDGAKRAIVLAQRQVDAVAQSRSAIRRLLLALLIAGVLAAVIGLLVAWRMARSLRRTATAAHSMALGNRDVTLPVEGPAEVAEVNTAMNTLAGALRHSEGRQREFLLSVSHDLRTPLTAITGYAESLAEGVVDAADAPYVGGVVLNEARRLERLVGDLLDLARLDAHDFRIDLGAVDLRGVVASAAQVWSARCAAGDVGFRLEASDVPIRTVTDAARVRQMLDGLFDNALRVTPAGSTIVLAARVEPPDAVLEVRDGGPGLTDADLGVAFDQGVLHQRYRGVRQVGTGLGLAIVRGLAQRLGGSVEAGHAQEGGARFTVRLPLVNQPR
ncbi:ATP-binding protein [uncultured Jatrophihabitans sp.]|uniref:sensor histidine kinase n=1 Tax=uncultured Jatrophihabitans sp. TaxID=1610747 RepID=UPI0035CAF841